MAAFGLLWIFAVGMVPGELRALRVIFTADLHARSQASVDFCSPGEPRRRLGGWAGLGYAIDSLRTAGTLLVDCGDFAFGSVEADSLQGRATVQLMNRAGYDAAALGARDFAGGLANVELLAAAAGFPVLADPMLDVALNRQTPLFRPYRLLDVRGVRVGLIGVTDPRIGQVNRADDVRGLAIDGPLVQVRRCLALAAADSCDLVVAFGHMTVDEGCAIADSLPGVALVLCSGPAAGNRLAARAGTPVLCSGEYGQRVGVVDVLLDARTRAVQQVEFALVNVAPESAAARPAAWDSLETVSAAEFAVTDSGRLELGLAAAEALRRWARADVAVVPLSAVESGIAVGPVLRYDAIGALPYHDRVRVVAADDTTLARLVCVSPADSTMPAPAIAGADYFVAGDTGAWPAVGRVARIRLRERHTGAHKVALTEQWMERIGLLDAGRLQEQDLTAVWLAQLTAGDTLRLVAPVRLYPATAGVTTTRPAGRVNINTADAELLCTLPGIGPKTAERIIEYRQTRGGFSSIEEINNVRGIGPKRYDDIKALITVR
jgi:competence ComEA-like helix-hairpin-helix protein